MSGLSFGFCNEWIVSLLSVGEQIGPFLTAESAESAEQLKNLCAPLASACSVVRPTLWRETANEWVTNERMRLCVDSDSFTGALHPPKACVRCAEGLRCPLSLRRFQRRFERLFLCVLNRAMIDDVQVAHAEREG